MYNQIKLDNNLNIITAPIEGAKTTTVLVMFATGSKHETKENNGISHFLEHMFFKGTTNRPNASIISTELDKIGAEFNAFTNKEYTGYWVKSASQHAELALDILSDMVINSKFDEEEIKREKGVIVGELNMYLDDPRMHIEDVFEELLYGDSPAGRDIIGPKKNIESFNRDDFTNYFKTQYGSQNCFVVLAGKIPEDSEAMIKKYFSNLQNTESTEKLPVIEKQDAPKIAVQYKDTDQAHLLLGVRAVPCSHPDEQITKLLTIILGGSMSSRLFTEIRERNGLAYYVSSGYDKCSDTGYLVTRSGVHISKINKAIEIIIKEYKKISEEIISEEELNKVKQLIIGRTTLQLEASDNIAQWFGVQSAILKQQKEPREVITPEQFIENVKKITAEDMQRVAKKIFTNKNLNLAVIGPYKNQDEFNNIVKF